MVLAANSGDYGPKYRPVDLGEQSSRRFQFAVNERGVEDQIPRIIGDLRLSPQFNLALQRLEVFLNNLRRQIHQIYGMCRRLGISAKARKESLSLYALARLLHKRPQIVRRWIESGALQAENEGTANVPRHMVSQDSLRRFCKDHPELIAGDRISQERLKFIFEYVFPRPHNDLLPVRESKKERAAYAQQMSAEEREDEVKLMDGEDYEESQEGL